MQQRIGVGVVIVNDDKLLLGKRKGSHGAGSWALPGGHLEPGESVFACAARETLEETGLQITNITNIDFSNDIFHSQEKQYITLFVKAISYSGSPKVMEPDKCEEWRWCSDSDIPSNLFKPLQSLFEQGFQL